MSIDYKHDVVLNAIEDVEIHSLRWGDVDGSLGREELIDLAAGVVETVYAEEIVEDLIDAALIYAIDVPGRGERYRTRFAEAMRLLVHARQVFRGESWRGAPPLVADFRVDLRPRQYPRRDRGSEEALDAQVHLTDVQRDVWRAIAPATLSRFQEDSAARLLARLKADDGTIITAGTGSGKTLAFYLPVLARIAELAKPNEFWTKAIAVYPRNELLKDQLTEAYRNARKANATLNRPGCRPLRVGAYFGSTPKSASQPDLRGWRRLPGGAYVCPFLRCDCDGDLIWRLEDLKERRERLVCKLECGHTFDEQTLPLTRQSIQKYPPDILFTTTEMLNRSLSNQYSRHLFGVRVSRGCRPKFVLLDEAHTYNGVAGAQAALTLRRWRALSGGPVRWVGLSATLQQAQEFFSGLTGLPAHQVAEVTPAEDDIVQEGREYQIAVRGDPASRTALLSTSIQATMLFARIMDTADCRSKGRFGRKLFAFTDDLDVTHRLHDDLMDAEGYDIFGTFKPTRGTLAALRASTRRDGNRLERENAGQVWRLTEEIGHVLGKPLAIARTTSRDPGVNREANVIVATSALEVGFNDPDVGVIVQHKAPRNFASFLQRRGRAGRDRRMRPLTLTVLSDYGRDRHLFQSFEHLFEPMLQAHSLPIQNQYVLRMQAAFALLDWIADRPLPNGIPRGHVWRTTSCPTNSNSMDKKFRKHLQDQLSLLIQGDQEAISSFTGFLKLALNVDDATVNSILWEPPRSILLEVVPTLLRRIYRDWELAWPSPSRKYERYVFDHPLPEAAPRTLFSDLNLPEVEILLPAATHHDRETTENLPIQQALTQLVPGRVSRRFGDSYGGLAHWIPVPVGKTEHVFQVDEFSEVHEFVGQFDGNDEKGCVNLPVYRPWRIRLDKANPGTVGPTSNAFLSWASGFSSTGDPVSIPPPPRTAWCGIVRDLRLFLHQFNSGVSVRRFATGANARIKRPKSDEQIVDISFVNGSGRPAAVGYEFETDGLALTLGLKSELDLATVTFEPALERALRSLHFRQLTAGDDELPRDMNVFQRDWVRRIFLLAVARRAAASGKDLNDCAQALASETDTSHFEEIMDALLGVQRPQPGSDSDDDNSEGQGNGDKEGYLRNRLERLKNSLRGRLADQSVRVRISQSLQTSLSSHGNERGNFLCRTLESTMADALIAAITASAPRHMATDALVADIAHNPEVPDEVTIWVTETTVGGAGVLQALSEQYAREPRSLFNALEAALEQSDLETASESLRQTYELISSDPEVAHGVELVRGEVSHEARACKRKELLQLLKARGVEVTRSFVVSLNSRVLTPGASAYHDKTVRSLLELWETAEITIGIELDPREVAALGAFDNDVSVNGTSAGLFEADSGPEARTIVLSGLLWPRTNALRREALATWTPFRKLITPIPQLVRAILLDHGSVAVSLEEDGWKDALICELAYHGAVRLEAPTVKHRLLRCAILEFLVSPVNVGHLQLFPALERITTESKKFTAHFVLREQV